MFFKGRGNKTFTVILRGGNQNSLTLVGVQKKSEILGGGLTFNWEHTTRYIGETESL